MIAEALLLSAVQDADEFLLQLGGRRLGCVEVGACLPVGKLVEVYPCWGCGGNGWCYMEQCAGDDEEPIERTVSNDRGGCAYGFDERAFRNDVSVRGKCRDDLGTAVAQIQIEVVSMDATEWSDARSELKRQGRAASGTRCEG